MGGLFTMYDRRPEAPVSVGEELDVTIEAVGEKGDGVARKKGFVLFVPNTKEGETCRIRVNKVLKKVGFAEKIGEATGAVEESAPREESNLPPPEPDQVETPVEDTEDFGEEAPAEEAPAEEAPAEEIPAEEAPQEEAPAEEAPKEEPAPEEEKS